MNLWIAKNKDTSVRVPDHHVTEPQAIEPQVHLHPHVT